MTAPPKRRKAREWDMCVVAGWLHIKADCKTSYGGFTQRHRSVHVVEVLPPEEECGDEVTAPTKRRARSVYVCAICKELMVGGPYHELRQYHEGDWMEFREVLTPRRKKRGKK